MTAKRKGDILEDLVAMMHDVPGVVVEKRQKLPVLRSTRKRYREVDVLITTKVLGYPVRFAIGCKNESKPLGAAAVDNFVGILKETGIPLQHGILVSTNGYTSDARDAASLEGIKTLVFEGLGPDRLDQAINAAIQSTVFLLITESAFDLFPYVEGRVVDNPQFVNAVLDKIEKPSATDLFSALAWLWISETIPATVGEHIISLTPKSEEAAWRVIATVTVTGFIASVPGTFSQGILKNVVEAGQIEKLHISAKFDEIKGPLTLAPVKSEDALSAVVHKEPLSFVTRVRVPRVVTNVGYWPPTEEAVLKVKALIDEGRPVTFKDIESSNLADAWAVQKRHSR